MKIYTRIVMDMKTGAIEESDSFEYEGPVASCDPGSIVTSIVGSIASSLVSNMFSKTPEVADVPAPPAPELPKPMPTPDDAAQQASRERQRAAQVNKMRGDIGGHLSTILTEQKQKSPLGA